MTRSWFGAVNTWRHKPLWDLESVSTRNILLVEDLRNHVEISTMHLTVLVYWSVAISLHPLVDSFSQYFRVQTIMHHDMETKSRGWNELGVSEEKILLKKCSEIRTRIVSSLLSFICWGWHQLNMLCDQKHVILIKTM